MWSGSTAHSPEAEAHAVTGDAEAAVKENLARRREEYDFRRLFFCIFISEYCMSN